MSKKSANNIPIFKAAKLAGIDAEITVLEDRITELEEVSTNILTFSNGDGAVKMNAKKIGKTFRKFRDDCWEHIQMDISTVGKKEDVGVGQLFIAFNGLDNSDVMHLTIKSDCWIGHFPDKELGKLIRKFRDYMTKTHEFDMAKATKLDDEMLGSEFIAFVSNEAAA